MWCFRVCDVAVCSFTPPPTLDKTKLSFCKKIFIDADTISNFGSEFNSAIKIYFAKGYALKYGGVGCCHKGLEYWNKVVVSTDASDEVLVYNCLFHDEVAAVSSPSVSG
jgi:hypothetical protein